MKTWKCVTSSTFASKVKVMPTLFKRLNSLCFQYMEYGIRLQSHKLSSWLSHVHSGGEVSVWLAWLENLNRKLLLPPLVQTQWVRETVGCPISSMKRKTREVRFPLNCIHKQQWMNKAGIISPLGSHRCQIRHQTVNVRVRVCLHVD